MEGLAGVTVIALSAAAEMVSVVEPVTAPEVAVIVALPWPTPTATPTVPPSLLIVATVEVFEFH